MTLAPPCATFNATVISHFGNEVLIEDTHGQRLRAIPRQSLPGLATGDQVSYEDAPTGLAVITAVAQRHGTLTRTVKNNQEKVVATNIDQVAIVCAAKPALRTGLIDRYLVACELAGLTPIIVFNKLDLLDDKKLHKTQESLAVYERIGYPVYYVSATNQIHIGQLHAVFAGKTSILVGHSGVGKSSLIRVLLPDAQPRIGAVSDASNKGRHTTTHTELYRLPGGGYIIDSPGIREFGLTPVDAHTLAGGFIEFRPYIGRCKFRNCTHGNDPGCAIIQAVDDGKIDPARLQGYHAILASMSE